MALQTNTLKPQPQSYEQGLSGLPALLAMIGISLTVLLSALDQTIVGTALPRIVAELHGFDLYAWVATSYLLTSTVMVPIMGKLGDLYGRKAFLLAAIAIFVAASLACGAATSMIFLIIARGVQGVGAGMLQATAFTSVGDMFPQPERRARWQGIITSTFGLASVVGPTLGGIMTDTLGWRSVFYVNLPVGILAIVVLIFALPAKLSPRTPHARVDWAGAALITTAVSAFLLAVEWGGEVMPWGSPTIIGLLAGRAPRARAADATGSVSDAYSGDLQRDFAPDRFCTVQPGVLHTAAGARRAAPERQRGRRTADAAGGQHGGWLAAERPAIRADRAGATTDDDWRADAVHRYLPDHGRVAHDQSLAAWH